MAAHEIRHSRSESGTRVRSASASSVSFELDLRLIEAEHPLWSRLNDSVSSRLIVMLAFKMCQARHSRSDTASIRPVSASNPL